MRTKIAILSAVALAAGLSSSLAQSNVYSVNIVGYVNLAGKNGLTLQSNPLDANGGNNAGNVINNTVGQWDTSEIQRWTGVSYNVAVFDSLTDDTTTGFTDRFGNPVPAPVLSNGVGFFFNNLTGTSNLVTYVGTVRNAGTGSTLLTNSVVLPSSPALSFVSAPFPIAGGVQSLGFTNIGGVLDTCEIQVPNISPGGGVVGFTIAVYDSLTDDTTTGFTDRFGNPVPEPVIAVGQSFFFNNLSGSPKTALKVVNVGP